MMLIIHGFPPTTKYAHVKDLIREVCHIDINNFILDNLLVEDGGKKVRIGLSDETDGYRVLQCLDGFRMSGSHVLRVESVKALKPENQRPVFQDPPRNIDYPGNQNYQDQSNYHDHGPGPNQGPNSGPMDNRYPGPGPMDSRGPNYPGHGNMDSRYPSHGAPDSRPDSHGPMGARPGPGGPMDTRPGFQNQIRSDSHGPNDSRYHDQFQNHGGPDMSQNQGPRSFGSNEPTRNQNWQPNVPQNNNQWSENQGAPPMQQNLYNVPQQNMNPGFDQQMPVQEPPYGQGRPPQDQSYGYPRKSLPVPEMNKRGPIPPEVRPSLRPIECVDTQQSQYPRDKPITIMKDNFKGPTQYNAASLTPSQGPIQPQPWASQVPQQKPYEKSFDKRPDIKPLPERGDNRRYSPTRDTRSPPRDIRGFSDGKGGPNRRSSPIARHSMSGGRPISPPGRKDSSSGPGRRISPSGRKISPFGRRISPSGRGISPSGRRISPSGLGRRISPSGPGRRISPPGPGRRISPSGPGRKISPSGPGRRISPSGPGRRISPSGPGRRISPSGPGRRTSPGRRISPSGRRASPPSFGRRISPGRRMSPGRRISPSERRISPSDRRLSPKRRISPGLRISPPGRRISPGRRMSPGRHLSPGRLARDEQRRPSPSMMSYNYREGERRLNVRPDLHRFSPKRDSPSRRSPGRPRFSPARHQDKPTDKYDDVKVKPIRAAYEPTGPGAQTQYSGGYRPSLHENVQYPIGISHWQKDKYAPSKTEEEMRDMPRMGGDSKLLSRSPGRSRSPKDRFRRHSPSPRSPRRSWALEKRRSPEEMTAPPPPVWPGQEQEKSRTRFDDPPNKPVWERPDDLRPDDRRPNDRRPEPADFKEKFTRAKWEEAREPRNYHTDEIKLRDERRQDRRESPREETPRLTEIDKDIQDIYKRALEFRKKTEEIRKSGEKKREDHHPDRHDKYAREDSPGRTKLEAYKRDLDRKVNDRANDSSNQFDRRYLPPDVKAKRQKAIDEISAKILAKHHFKGEPKRRILEELKLALAKTFYDMFGVEDISYIELVIKYRARYSGPDEEKILMDVLSSLPSQYQHGLKKKRDDSGVPAKITRHSSPPAPKQGKRDDHSSSSVISRAAALYPTDRPTKRSAPVEKSAAKRMKTEDLRETNNPLDRYKSILVTAAGPQHTDYELSHLMTNIVENELNLLMDKIYETFPKEVTNEAEKVVYNKYKGQVGAALRNTIGLNITKRLLNVRDRLLVKLTFSSTPSGKELDKFINVHKLVNFKKIPHLNHTFVADLKSYTDLDNLCSVKNLRCGGIEITAKPCIPFMKCPQNLKTKFRSAYIQTDQKQTDTQSENILNTKEKEKTDITTKDTKAEKVKAIESKESNQNLKVTKATTQNKSQETPKVTQKSQAVNKVSENTKVSSTKTQEPAKPTQTKPETVAKVTTPAKTEEHAKAKTITKTTEDATKEKATTIKTEKITPKKTEESTKTVTITIKAEKTTPSKTEETSEAKTTPRKLETTATAIKTEKITPKATAPKTITDSDKPKTSVTNTETTAIITESIPKVISTPTKPKEIPKAKTSETATVPATKLDTTKAKTTPTTTETTTNATTPAKTESKVSKTQDTPKTTPKTLENKVKTQNEVSKSITQTKTPEVKKPTATKPKEEQSKPVNTKTTTKTTVTKKEVVNKNKEVNKLPERKKRASDFDELDDQDILAMLSGGIILDECSGSDDE